MPLGFALRVRMAVPDFSVYPRGFRQPKFMKG
jgi:hypothetical protein